VNPADRRSFIASAAALAGASFLPDIVEAAQNPQGGWDFSFLEGMNGKHRQVFDISDLDIGLVVVKNWFDAWESVYGLKHPDVNAIVGIAGKGFPINASDALYQKFPIGELWKVNDPSTGKPALRSPYVAGDGRGPMAGAGVRPLQARGAVFWMCNNALNNVAGRIGNAVQRPQPEIYQEVRAGLNPGVIVVPAHTMLLGLAQERNFAYEMV
jgi:hypothetical protein